MKSFSPESDINTASPFENKSVLKNFCSL